MWQADNRFIRQNTGFTVQFERLVTDYEYFRSQLIERLGLSIDEGAWQGRTARVTNPTPRHKYPPYDEWPAHDKATFDRICGEEMEACGYRD